MSQSNVAGTSLLTLHYRLSLADGTPLVSTFEANPATLQLGSGDLAPALEACLAGLPVGERHVFLLDAGQAFGAHDDGLVRRMPRRELPGGGELEEFAMIEFHAPDGASFAGLVREVGEDYAVIDFNHPLAGKAVRFEVEVIGIL